MFEGMGRLILLLLIVLAVWLLWRAFGPGSSERYGSLLSKNVEKPPAIKAVSYTHLTLPTNREV